jgi:hypothetical protein
LEVGALGIDLDAIEGGEIAAEVRGQRGRRPGGVGNATGRERVEP